MRFRCTCVGDSHIKLMQRASYDLVVSLGKSFYLNNPVTLPNSSNLSHSSSFQHVFYLITGDDCGTDGAYIPFAETKGKVERFLSLNAPYSS